MRKVTSLDRLRYAFDNFMSRGTIALIAGLTVVSATVIVAAALLVTVAHIWPGGSDAISLPEALWLSLLRTLDPGTMGGDAGLGLPLGDAGRDARRHLHHQRPDRRAQQRHRGQARRAAQGPLARDRVRATPSSWAGRTRSSPSSPSWSSPMPTSRTRCIVVLGEHDKVDMETEIRDKVGSTGRTRSRLPHRQPHRPDRSGDRQPAHGPRHHHPWPGCGRPRLARHQDHAGHHQQPQPPAGALSHRGRDSRSQEPGSGPHGGRGRGGAGAGGRPDRAHHRPDLPPVGPVGGLHRAARLRRRRDLLTEEPALVGKTFGEALLAYEDSAVLGLAQRGRPPASSTRPWTPASAAGDQVIAISEDDDTVQAVGPAPIGRSTPPRCAATAPRPTRPSAR